MNTDKIWMRILNDVNEQRKPLNTEIRITEPEDEGYFDCEIWKFGEYVETYAGNYRESELEELIEDAYHYVLENPRIPCTPSDNLAGAISVIKNLDDEKKVEVLAELYLSLNDSNKDEFLRKTGNE